MNRRITGSWRASRSPAQARRLAAAAAVIALVTSPLVAATAATAAPASHHPRLTSHSITIHGDRTVGGARTVRPSGKARAVPLPRINLHQLSGKPALRVTPHDLRPATPSITANFAGLAQAEQHIIVGADPSAATNGSQIMETSADTITVFSNGGQRVCATIPLNRLLNAAGHDKDLLQFAQVQYDSANQRFIMLSTIETGFSTDGSPPATNQASFYVAVSAGNDPCGSWFPYLLHLNGTGSDDLLSNPSLGQTPRSVLVGVTEHSLGTFSDTNNGLAFAIPKPPMYSDSAVSSSPVFTVAPNSAAGVAAVTTAGTPMLNAPSGWFLRTGVDAGGTSGIQPLQGYALFRMDGDGSASPSISQQSVFQAPFQVPDNPGLPGTSARVSLGQNGSIQASPVYDGSRIWFAQTTKEPGGPATTVRFGYINPASSTLALALARHSTTSADFNPSIGVGTGTGGIESVFLNWVASDPSRNVPLSPTVATLAYNGSGTFAFAPGTDQILIAGGTPSSDVDFFSTWSSVSIDPAVPTGTCAVTSQESLGTGGAIQSRVARLCAPAMVNVPYVLFSTVPGALALLHDSSLAGDNQPGTTNCDNSQNGLVVGQSPAAGQLAQVGSEVTLTVCNLNFTVPALRGLSDDSAQNRITSAGFTVGSIQTISDCTVEAGDVSKSDPPAGTVHTRGTPISIWEATGFKTNGRTPCTIE